jgi:hypothetical protein
MKINNNLRRIYFPGNVTWPADLYILKFKPSPPDRFKLGYLFRGKANLKSKRELSY